MAQPAELYVDPSIAADSGAGTVGDPYGDLEYCLEQEDYDNANGLRVNIKNGTDEILAADLVTAMADTSAPGKSVAWVPGIGAPLVFQGYTTAAGDGGIGGISGGGAVGILTSATHDYIAFIDMHLHNCGANIILDIDNDCAAIRCEINNSSAGGIALDNRAFVDSCYVHDTGGFGIDVVGGSVTNCYCKNDGTNDFTAAIRQQSSGLVYRNIIDVDAASNGISGTTCNIIQNSIYSNAGTGTGIYGVTNTILWQCVNNLVEGFSGAGGKGINYAISAGQRVGQTGGNSVYNCTDEYVAVGDWLLDDLGDETLVASPFTAAATGNFSPVDTGSVKEGSLPQVIGGGLVP